MKKLSKSALRSIPITRGICPNVRSFPITQSPTRWFKTRERDEVMVKVMKMSWFTHYLGHKVIRPLCTKSK